MVKICKLKSVIFILVIFTATVAYAAALKEIAISDLTWPLLFNGIAPGAILAWVGKRYVDKQDRVNKELIECKNDHAKRLDGIEMIHQLRGCDQPDKMQRNRRKEDK